MITYKVAARKITQNITFSITILVTALISGTIRNEVCSAFSSELQPAFVYLAPILTTGLNARNRRGAFRNPTRPSLLDCHNDDSAISDEQLTDFSQDHFEQLQHLDLSFWKPTCNIEESSSSTVTINSLLVCGDGDLSYSASISRTVSQYGIKLIATVLEEEAVHQEVYAHSEMNQCLIQKAGQKVRFGIDATKLNLYFGPDVKFDRIQFNFPHWKGKANHKHNRKLLDDFLKSAAEFISPDGEIHVALCQGQGGSEASTLEEWKDSWTPSVFAAEHDLLLFDVFAYKPEYNLSSHRGKDRGFNIGMHPMMYVFGKSKGPTSKVPRIHQLCTRHELHIMIPDKNDTRYDSCSYTNNTTPSFPSVCTAQKLPKIPTNTSFDIVNGVSIINIIRDAVPEGIRVEVPDRRILRQEDSGFVFVVFLIVYCGEYRALRRSETDGFRSDIETKVEQHVALRESRKGKFVSKPFPYALLDSILEKREMPWFVVTGRTRYVSLDLVTKKRDID